MSVDLNDRCFHLQNEKPNQSPILLIHGLSLSLEVWSTITEVLALGTGRRVCAVDLRNHGDSPHADLFDVEVMCKDIEHFLDKKGIKTVNIIGHSLGGKIAVHYTLNHPERVDSVVVEDMRPNGVSQRGRETVIGATRMFQEAIKSVPEGASEQEATKILLNVFKERMAKMGMKGEIEASMMKMFPMRRVDGIWEWKVNIDAVNKAVQNLDGFLTESTGVFRGPTLFIYGTESEFDVAGDKENILKLFPNVKLIPVEGAGHLIHTSSSKFTDEVIKMINEID